MSEACIYNPYEECFRNCEGCVIRYAPPKNRCKYCGDEDDLYDFGDEYVCGYCLKNKVIGKDGVKDKEPVLDFIEGNIKDFSEFAERWYSARESDLINRIIDDIDGEIIDFQALSEFLSEYDDEFRAFLEEWFSVIKVG